MPSLTWAVMNLNANSSIRLSGTKQLKSWTGFIQVLRLTTLAMTCRACNDKLDKLPLNETDNGKIVEILMTETLMPVSIF